MMLTLRPATPADIPAVHALIRELADYEKLSDQMQMTPTQLHQALFGDPAYAQVLLAECQATKEDGDPSPTPPREAVVGFALYFFTFSTFVGQPSLYLEDLYVQPAFRGQGIGKRLLAALVTVARERGCGRMEWSVLDWNQPAIAFYRQLGAVPMDDWTTYRLTAAALEHFPHPTA